MSEGVSRQRRRLFTYAVVGGSCLGALVLALRGNDTRVAQIVAEGFMSLALATACTYVGASSVDYTFGDRRAFHSFRQKTDEAQAAQPQKSARED